MGFNVESSKPFVDFFAKQGMDVIQTGNYIGGRYTYIDTLDAYGMIIELCESV